MAAVKRVAVVSNWQVSPPPDRLALAGPELPPPLEGTVGPLKLAEPIVKLCRAWAAAA